MLRQQDPPPSTFSGTSYQNENAPNAPSVRNAAARKNQLCSGTTRAATSSCSNASTGRSSTSEARPWDDRLLIASLLAARPSAPGQRALSCRRVSDPSPVTAPGRCREPVGR